MKILFRSIYKDLLHIPIYQLFLIEIQSLHKNFLMIQIDPDLVKPTMRAALEEQFNLIAQGMAVFQDVLHHGIDIFGKKYKYFIEHISHMDQLFEVTFTSLAASGKPLSRF